MSDCTDIHTQTSCVHVCNELIKNAEQHAVKAHDYKAPEFFGTIKLDTVKYGVWEWRELEEGFEW